MLKKDTVSGTLNACVFYQLQTNVGSSKVSPLPLDKEVILIVGSQESIHNSDLSGGRELSTEKANNEFVSCYMLFDNLGF